MKKETIYKIEEIKRVWRPGIKPEEIAKMVNFEATAKQISRLIYRYSKLLALGTLTGRRKKADEPKVEKPKVEKQKVEKPKVEEVPPTRQAIIKAPPIDPSLRFIHTEPALPKDFQHLTLMELAFDTCRFPTGNSNYRFCGCSITRGAYCEYHARITYNGLNYPSSLKAKKILARMS